MAYELTLFVETTQRRRRKRPICLSKLLVRDPVLCDLIAEEGRCEFPDRLSFNVQEHIREKESVVLAQAILLLPDIQRIQEFYRNCEQRHSEVLELALELMSKQNRARVVCLIMAS